MSKIFVQNRQFEFINDPPEGAKTLGGQITAILKLQYPPIIETNNRAGKVIKKRHASKWLDYYLIKDELGETCADTVKDEFWVMN